MSSVLAKVTSALDRLSVDELSDVIEAAKTRLERRQSEAMLEARVGRDRHCPDCGSVSFLRWGRARTGTRRWRCRDCGRTFTSATGTLLERARKRDELLAVAKDMTSGRPSSCRAMADALGVHRMTVWRWRMRLMDAIGDAGQRDLAGIVEADETFFRESRKGSREWVRHIRDPRRYPQPPRMRWRDYERLKLPLPRGLGRWQIPVVVIRDRTGATAANRTAGTSLADIAPVLDRSMAPDAMLCTDAAGVYRQYAAGRSLAIEQVNSSLGQRVRAAGAFHIQNVNAFHARFKEFMAPFRGPATHNLSRYVTWMLLRDACDGQARTDDAVIRRALNVT